MAFSKEFEYGQVIVYIHKSKYNIFFSAEASKMIFNRVNHLSIHENEHIYIYTYIERVNKKLVTLMIHISLHYYKKQQNTYMISQTKENYPDLLYTLAY